MAVFEMNGGSGGGASEVLECSIILKLSANAGYLGNINDSTGVMVTPTPGYVFTGTYIKNTWNSKYEAVQDCRVTIKKMDGTMETKDVKAGDTIYSYTFASATVGSAFGVFVLG